MSALTDNAALPPEHIEPKAGGRCRHIGSPESPVWNIIFADYGSIVIRCLALGDFVVRAYTPERFAECFEVLS